MRANMLLESKKKRLRAERLALVSFQDHLRKKYGNVLRAWLAGIDLDGSMTVSGGIAPASRCTRTRMKK